MSMLSWAAVEDAVVEALKIQLGAELKTVQSYQGNWQRDLQEQSWRLPAALVMVTRSRSEQVSAASFDLTLELQVLVIVRQLRGETAGRRGAGGAYGLLAGIREALWHRDLGIDMTPLSLIREEPLLNDGEFTVYTAHYRTSAFQDR